jgi:hypothetical protein
MNSCQQSHSSSEDDGWAMWGARKRCVGAQRGQSCSDQMSGGGGGRSAGLWQRVKQFHLPSMREKAHMAGLRI